MEFNADQIRQTLAALMHEQGQEEIGAMLDASRATVSFRHSDFGRSAYSLDLRIPLPLMARLESKVDKIEKLLVGKLPRLGIDTSDESVDFVNIFLDPPVGAGAVSVRVPTRSDEARIWKPGMVRLFLSHLNGVKVEVSRLKVSLSTYGVDCFVAHEDIEPSQAWHEEIEFALRSMDALCAVVTPGFNASKWTDQEVGFGLGRNVPVIALKCGHDPYGLLGKHQALNIDLARSAPAAEKIMEVMFKQESLRTKLVAGLAAACAASASYQDAKLSAKMVAKYKADLTDAQIVELLKATKLNSQVREANGVPEIINSIARGRGVTLPKDEPKPAWDDDIPF
jgi:hypothetical protein